MTTAPNTAFIARLESAGPVEAAYLIKAEVDSIARFSGVPANELGLDIYTGEPEPAWLSEVA